MFVTSYIGYMVFFGFFLNSHFLYLFCSFYFCVKVFSFRLFSQFFYFFLFSIFLPFFEWLRGNILTGFPWNMIGFSLSSPLEIAQSIAFLGPYGQNVLIALVLTIPISVYYNKNIFTLLSIFSSGLVFLTSIYTFKSNTISFTDNDVQLVQPNFSHSDKWDKKKFFINLKKLLELSKNNSGKNTSPEEKIESNVNIFLL
jgi:apolipoprotein N-acyltransferase